ncbi:MAG: aminotransferase class IV [Pseudomonadota bacterium]
MTDWSKGAAWMEGRVIPIAEAKIHVMDWALTHSDVTYDVVPVREGAFFRLDDYLDRFEASTAACRLDPGLGRAAIKSALHAIVAQAGLRDAYCSMTCARGVPLIPGSRDPRDCGNHFYAWAVPYIHVVTPDVVARGAKLKVASARRIPEDSVNPRAKNYHWGDFTQGIFEAKEAGFDNVMLLDHDDNVTEGPGFNVFAVKDDRVVTSDHGVLHGITRRTVIEMCEELGLTVDARPLPLDELYEADEVFLSSSGGGAMPVVQVEERIFGNGAHGPVAAKLAALYWDWTRRPEHREEIAYAVEAAE